MEQVVVVTVLDAPTLVRLGAPDAPVVQALVLMHASLRAVLQVANHYARVHAVESVIRLVMGRVPVVVVDVLQTVKGALAVRDVLVVVGVLRVVLVVVLHALQNVKVAVLLHAAQVVRLDVVQDALLHAVIIARQRAAEAVPKHAGAAVKINAMEAVVAVVIAHALVVLLIAPAVAQLHAVIIVH